MTFFVPKQKPKPEVYLMVYDESGAPIRRVVASVDEGFHRVVWELRFPRLPKPKPNTRGKSGRRLRRKGR